MPTVISRLIDEARMWKTNTGLRAVEKYQVLSTLRGKQFTDSLAALPDIGADHPENSTLNAADKIYCSGIEMQPIAGNNSNMQAVLTFEPDGLKTRKPSLTGFCTVETRVIIVQKEFFTDRTGATMFVKGTRNGKTLQPQSVKAQVPFPMTYITFRRYEPRPRDLTSLQPYIACTNSVPFTVTGKVDYQKIRTVLCTGITMIEENNAALMSYEFQAFGLNVVPNNTSCWDQYEYYKDPVTKEILTNSTPGVTLTSDPPYTNPAGVASSVPGFRVIGEIDFLGLNLH